MLVIEAVVENTIAKGGDIAKKVQLTIDPQSKRPVMTSANLHGDPLKGVNEEISTPVKLLAGDLVHINAKENEVIRVTRGDKVHWLHPLLIEEEES